MLGFGRRSPELSCGSRHRFLCLDDLFLLPRVYLNDGSDARLSRVGMMKKALARMRVLARDAGFLMISLVMHLLVDFGFSSSLQRRVPRSWICRDLSISSLLVLKTLISREVR